VSNTARVDDLRDVSPDGPLGAGWIFFGATAWTKTRKGAPDGMRVDREGNRFAGGPSGTTSSLPTAAGTGIYRIR